MERVISIVLKNYIRDITSITSPRLERVTTIRNTMVTAEERIHSLHLEIATLGTSIVLPHTDLCISTIRGADGDLVFHVLPTYDMKIDSSHSLIVHLVPYWCKDNGIPLYTRSRITSITQLIDIVHGGYYTLRSISILAPIETRHVQAFFSNVDKGYNRVLCHFLSQHTQLRDGLLEIGFIVTCRGLPRDVVRLVMDAVMVRMRRTVWIGMRFYVCHEEFLAIIE